MWARLPTLSLGGPQEPERGTLHSFSRLQPCTPSTDPKQQLGAQTWGPRRERLCALDRASLAPARSRRGHGLRVRIAAHPFPAKPCGQAPVSPSACQPGLTSVPHPTGWVENLSLCFYFIMQKHLLSAYYVHCLWAENTMMNKTDASILSSCPNGTEIGSMERCQKP